MKAAIFAYSRQGCGRAEKLKEIFPDARLFTVEKYCYGDFCPIPKPSREFYGAQFHWADALIFVSSCGIAVRNIAPFVADKRTDPGVLVMDETAKFVIPLLSGHIGGANALAKTVADFMGATPAVTTATDVNGKFSVDAWAARNGFAISSMARAKAVSAAILEQPVAMTSDFSVVGDFPAGTEEKDFGNLGVYLTYRETSPFTETLRLVPQVLHLGIGCRKNTPAEAIEAMIARVFKENKLDARAVKCVASIDLKAEEQGLLQVCRDHGWPVTFYSGETLSQVEGDFTPSAFVKKITGVDNVCERSALLGADRLIVRKTAENGVTVAVAIENLEVHFG